MMRFDLSPEQQALKDTARRCAAEEIIPVAARFDEEVSIVSSYAKAFGGDHAMRITTDAGQVFGGYGS